MAVLDHDVLAFGIPEVPESLTKCCNKGMGGRRLANHSDPREFPRRLRLGDEGHGDRESPKEDVESEERGGMDTRPAPVDSAPLP